MPTEEEFLNGSPEPQNVIELPAEVPAPPVAEKPASEPAAEDPEEPKAEGATEPEAKPEGEGDKPKQTPWFQRRIDELIFRSNEAQQRAQRLEAELDGIRKAATTPPPSEDPAAAKPALSEADVDRRANEKAQQIAEGIAAKREFDNACNGVFEKGTKDYADFDSALSNFRLLGGLPPTLVEAAIESGEAPKVLYELGKNPDEAARILQMSPTRMAVAVAKLAAKQPPPPPAPPVSKAPSPIKPLAGAARVETDPDQMSTEEWMAWHDAREAKKRA